MILLTNRKRDKNKDKNKDKIGKLLDIAPLSISNGGPIDSLRKSKEYLKKKDSNYGHHSIFLMLLFLIIVAWILVAVWTKWLENFCYGNLGLDPKSSFHTFVVAVVITLIFIAFIFTVGNDEVFDDDNNEKEDKNIDDVVEKKIIN